MWLELRRGGVIGIVCVVAAVAACIVFRPERALRTATGMAAHDLCSETFVSGLYPQRTFDESIAPRPGMRMLVWALRYQLDRAKGGAGASFNHE
jgi:hypothetical protein